MLRMLQLSYVIGEVKTTMTIYLLMYSQYVDENMLTAESGK